MKTSDKNYDTIIIGGGPAGYTAALYAVRAGLDTILLERFSAGGQMSLTSQIDNYPGFEEGIGGVILGQKMQQCAERFGAVTVRAEVLSVDLASEQKCITTDSGDFLAKTVIIATGAEHRHLGLPNEDELIGRGVGYCAACDGMFYKGKTVAVVGGGNSATADTLLLSRICRKVYLIHRRDTLRATKIYYDQLNNADNVEFIWNSTVDELLFNDRLTGLSVKNLIDGSISSITCHGLFISIGRAPATAMFKDILELENGYIRADETTRTNIPGVFAAGDVRTKPVRQIVTATADGATAAYYAEQYLSTK